MAIDFLDLQNRCLARLGITSGAGVSTLRTRAKRALNDAYIEMYARFNWRERYATDFVSMLAPYTTGTATFTQGSQAVTGLSTVWTSGHTGMKIALAYDAPWYIFTRTGATTGTLDRAYVEADAAASAYVLYQDRYALLSTAMSILGREMVLHRQGYGRIGRMSRTDGEEMYTFPSQAGIPTLWEQHDVSSGSLRIRVYPPPDAVFSARYGYLKKATEMSGNTDEPDMQDHLRRILVEGALRDLYPLFDDKAKGQEQAALFDALVLAAWRRHKSEEPEVGQMLGLDETQRWPERTVGAVVE